MTRRGTKDWINWQVERDRIDLAAVATGFLRQAPGRQGERGSRLWWRCPFHEDRNPSFLVDPVKRRWRCYGCGKDGDAATLVMELDGVSFPEAVRRLVGGVPSPLGAARPPTRPEPTPAETPVGPSGMPEAEALALVVESSDRLWTAEGAGALAHLTDVRHLSPKTIRSARLGWTSGVAIPKKDGGTYEARGIVIPWLDRDRLTLVKIRQPDGLRLRYAEGFRERPTLFPDPRVIKPGLPLIVVEGEFDAMLLGQELGELASVVTLGSASNRPGPRLLGMMLAAPRWYISTDADDAGDRAAEGWPPRAHRARPPRPFKDWTEARQGGVDLRRWWTDRLGGIEAPRLFTWEDLAGWRWGPAAESANLDAEDQGRETLRSF